MKLPFLDKLLGALKGDAERDGSKKKKGKKSKGKAAKGATSSKGAKASKEASAAATGARKIPRGGGAVQRSQPASRIVADASAMEAAGLAESPAFVEAVIPVAEQEPVAVATDAPLEPMDAALADAPLAEAPVMADEEPPPASELEAAYDSGDEARASELLAAMLAAPRALRRAFEDKQGFFPSCQAQLERAIAQHDFLTLSFVGSTLVVDAAFYRDELHGIAQGLVEKGEALSQLSGKKAAAAAHEVATMVASFQETVQKKRKILETLEARLVKAFQSKDFATLSDLTGALSRDALILAAVDPRAEAIAQSQQTALTATSATEKAAMLDQQVSQLHQALSDRKYPAIADISRIISLNAGVLADPSTAKAAQILQAGFQLQQALKAAPENPANAAVGANLAKVASVFNGPLMDKASQLEGQVGQLQAALKGFDLAKMFTLSVTIARAAAILTDATIQKASLLAGYASRIDSSLKRKDFPGAASALKSALS